VDSAGLPYKSYREDSQLFQLQYACSQEQEHEDSEPQQRRCAVHCAPAYSGQSEGMRCHAAMVGKAGKGVQKRQKELEISYLPCRQSEDLQRCSTSITAQE
jgi:hypothetical protein